jgi:hypothetical protein
MVSSDWPKRSIDLLCGAHFGVAKNESVTSARIQREEASSVNFTLELFLCCMSSWYRKRTMLKMLRQQEDVLARLKTYPPESIGYAHAEMLYALTESKINILIALHSELTKPC